MVGTVLIMVVMVITAIFIVGFFLSFLYADHLGQKEKLENPEKTRPFTTQCPNCEYENIEQMSNRARLELEGSDNSPAIYHCSCDHCGKTYYQKSAFWGENNNSWKRKTPPSDRSRVIKE